MTTSTTLSPLVLVAEHDDVSRRRTQQLVESLGARCVTASDDIECISAYQAEPADFVLIASDLPGRDTVALLEGLRTANSDKASRTALIVNHDDAFSLELLQRLGVVDFLQRPVHEEIARHTLARLIASMDVSAGTSGSRTALIEHLREAIPIAQSHAKHIAIMYLSIQTDPSGSEDLVRLLETAFRNAQADAGSGLVVESGANEIRLARDGDDFIAIVTGLDRVQDAAKIAGRVHEAIDGNAHPKNTIGISAFPQDGNDPELLVDFAQDASSRARLEGRTSLEYYTESMSQWALERLTLEHSLRNALVNDELVVYYQPRVDISSRRILGMEALVRWIHPQLGLVSPAQFIPLAEETGLIGPIGEWVLREACRQNREWRDMGHPDIRVSVNLSPLQFRQSDLAERICEVLEETQLPASGLEVEVTESMLMHDPKATIAALEKIKSAGITISIDDFGTGYSSLSYLKQFPINALKIDRSFVRDITTNSDDAAIATAIILMGNSLKLEVIAEGVETESQMAFLQVLQCDEIQGYLISPPVPSQKAERLLAAQISHAA